MNDFLFSGLGLGGLLGKPVAKPDGWLSGDEALERYAKAPDTITKAVEAERDKHLKCATDEKRLRCDVERILDAKICYLEFTCAGCGMSKRVQVDEKTGTVAVLKETYPPVVNPMTKAERIEAKYPQIYMPKITPRPSPLYSAMRYEITDLADAYDMKPLVSSKGKLKRKEEPKPPAKPLVDRLRIVRASPVHDEEV